MKKDIKAGFSNNQMFDKWLGRWHQYKTTFKEYRREMYPERDWETRTEVYWSKDSGTGKTWRAKHESHKFDRHASLLMPGRKGEKMWGDNLEGAQAITMEDFEPEIVPFNAMLRMLDRNALMLDVKFGTINFAPTNIYITSNYHPKEWYPEHPWEGISTRTGRYINPLRRRLHEFGLICEHVHDWKPPVVVIVPDSDTEDDDDIIDLRAPREAIPATPTSEMLDAQDADWLAKAVESEMKMELECPPTPPAAFARGAERLSPYNSDSDNF